VDKASFEKVLKMLESGSDSDIAMGVRALNGMFAEEGVTLGQLMAFGFSRLDQVKTLVAPAAVVEQQVQQTPATTQRSPVQMSGMPQCQSPRAGCVEIIPPGQTTGEVLLLPGSAAPCAQDIANGLKDALVAAVINKSRFKLKLFDIKNAKGEVVETALQAEYEREGMTPVRVWVNVRGEVATLAAVLRKAVANSMPDLVAA
jgi:hypothetical protein